MANNGRGRVAKVTMQSAENVARKLGLVNTKLLDRFERRGLAHAAKPIVDAAKSKLEQNGSVDFGALRESIDVKQARYRKRSGIYALVGPARGAKFNIVDAVTGRRIRVPVKYAHLVEFGTAPHRQTQGEHPGASAKPFMRPAFDSAKGTVEKRVEVDLRKALGEAVNDAR